jgi:hypothetical protein
MSARIAELQQLAEEQTKRITGGSRGVGGGTSSFTTGPEGGVQSGHFSFSRSNRELAYLRHTDSIKAMRLRLSNGCA